MLKANLFFCLLLILRNALGLNSVTFNPNNTNRNTPYMCAVDGDCQIICEGKEVCKGATFVCPNDYSCDITCRPDNIGEGPNNRNSCEGSTIIATNTPLLTLECRNFGCHNMVINMTHGKNLMISGPYMGYEGIYKETNEMQGMIVYGEYLDSVSIGCYNARSCYDVIFYLNYTKSININADSKNTMTTNTGNDDWAFRYGAVYAQNAGDIYFYCGWIGCIESNPLIDASNANSLNLTCNGFYACAANEIYCPNNGPRGDPSTIINIDFTAQSPLIQNTIYAVEQFNDVVFNCIGTCAIDSKGNKIKCNPSYSSECELVDDGDTTILCPIGNILDPPECTTYLLPTLSPTTTPTRSPTISTSHPSISPTKSPSIAPTKMPTRSPSTTPTIETLMPTNDPTAIPSTSPSGITEPPSQSPIMPQALSTGLSPDLQNWIIVGTTLVLCIACCVTFLCFYRCFISSQKAKHQTQQDLETQIAKKVIRELAPHIQNQIASQQNMIPMNSSHHQQYSSRHNGSVAVEGINPGEIVNIHTNSDTAPQAYASVSPKLKTYENSSQNRYYSTDDDKNESAYLKNRNRTKGAELERQHFPNDPDDEPGDEGASAQITGDNIDEKQHQPQNIDRLGLKRNYSNASSLPDRASQNVTPHGIMGNNSINNGVNLKPMSMNRNYSGSNASKDFMKSKSQNTTPRGIMGSNNNHNNNHNNNSNHHDNQVQRMQSNDSNIDDLLDLPNESYNNVIRNQNNDAIQAIVFNQNINKNADELKVPLSQRTGVSAATASTFETIYDDDEKRIELPSDEDSQNTEFGVINSEPDIYNDNNTIKKRRKSKQKKVKQYNDLHKKRQSIKNNNSIIHENEVNSIGYLDKNAMISPALKKFDSNRRSTATSVITPINENIAHENFDNNDDNSVSNNVGNINDNIKQKLKYEDDKMSFKLPSSNASDMSDDLYNM